MLLNSEQTKKTKYLVLKGIDSCTPSQSGMCGRATPDIWPLCHCVACSSTSPATHSRVTTIVDKVRKHLEATCMWISSFTAHLCRT